MQEHFDNFFEDVFVELEDKYGEIEEMNVCDNLGDHLVGNVYVKVGGSACAFICGRLTVIVLCVIPSSHSVVMSFWVTVLMDQYEGWLIHLITTYVCIMFSSSVVRTTRKRRSGS